MTSVRVGVVRVAGTNSDQETARAFELADAEAEVVHLNRLLEAPERLQEYGVVCIPGGFSYGDDIGSGVVLAHQLRGAVLRPAIERFLDRGGLLLGICNGFQALLKAGLLTADEGDGHFEPVPSATLTWNSSARYECRWVRLTAPPGISPWIPTETRMECPVRHAEGRFVCRDDATFRRLDEDGRLILRYAGAHWGPATGFPDNPNGSPANVAGVCSAGGRVLGLMPHPECHVEYWHHPEWTRQALRGDGDGLALFRAGVTAALEL